MRLDASYALKLAGTVAMGNAIVFILIEVIWAEAIEKIAERTDYTLTLMIFGGFMLAAILSIFISKVGSESIRDSRVIWIAALLTYVFNTLLWIIICYVFVLISYPEILSGAPGIEKLGVMPQVVKTFAIYILPNFTLLWLISGISFVIIYIILLYAFKAEIKKEYKSTKGTFW